MKVIVDGDIESINEYIKSIITEDIRIRKSVQMYTLTQPEEYDGPEIDWNRYEIKFMSRQTTKDFREANKRLGSIESEINKLKS